MHARVASEERDVEGKTPSLCFRSNRAEVECAQLRRAPVVRELQVGVVALGRGEEAVVDNQQLVRIATLHQTKDEVAPIEHVMMPAQLWRLKAVDGHVGRPPRREQVRLTRTGCWCDGHCSDNIRWRRDVDDSSVDLNKRTVPCVDDANYCTDGPSLYTRSSPAS